MKTPVFGSGESAPLLRVRIRRLRAFRNGKMRTTRGLGIRFSWRGWLMASSILRFLQGSITKRRWALIAILTAIFVAPVGWVVGRDLGVLMNGSYVLDIGATPLDLAGPVTIGTKWVTVGTESEIVAKLADPNVQNIILLSPITLTADRTFNKAVYQVQGAIITTNRHTLTINADVPHGPYQRFNAASGEVIGLVQVYPEWWRTNIVPGATDMAPAINKALLTNIIPDMSQSTYFIGSTLIIPNGLGIRGKGTTIKANSAITMLQSSTARHGGLTLDISLSDITFDGSGVATQAIELGHPGQIATNIKLNNIHILNCLSGAKFVGAIYSMMRDVKIQSSYTTDGTGLLFAEGSGVLCLNITVQGYKYNWWVEGSGLQTDNCGIYTDNRDIWTTHLLVLHNASNGLYHAMVFEHQANTAIDEALIYEDGDGFSATSAENKFDACRWIGTQQGNYASKSRVNIGQTGEANRTVYKTQFVNSMFMSMYIPAVVLNNASLTTLDRCYHHDNYGGSGAYTPLIVGNLDTTLTTVIPVDFPCRKPSIPTTDLNHIWRVGDAIWNTGAAAGSSPGWVCTTAGILSNRSIATGVTTTGSPTVTGLANIYGMEIGGQVTISNGFATTGPFTIIRRTVSSITVNATATSDQSGVTIANQTAEFKAMANLAN